jgi:CBS domain-containing protein
MNASDSMTRYIVVVPPETSSQLAWAIMRGRGIRHLPVVKAGKLHGMLSDRDLLLRARVADGGGIEIPAEPVAMAMTTVVEICTADDSVGELAARMIDLKIDALPVVGAGGRLMGLVTSTDLPSRRLPFAFRLDETALEDVV